MEDPYVWLAGYWLLTRELLLLAAAGVLVSSLDDLLFDLVYFSRRIWRRLTVYRGRRRTDARSLPGGGSASAPIAVFVPAWDEADVIGPMLTAFTRRMLFPHYRVFVGVYPNDAATLRVVAALSDPRIAVVIVERDGPTTKAHCLNAIWRAMCRHEDAYGVRFKAIVLHDAEDVVHPRELGVIDYLIPAKAMVQLPVVPFAAPNSRWIAGHYLDEFAESHTKDMVVREAIGAAIPAAGVACGFERAMMGWIADDLGGAPFDPLSLTEDYELGHRIHARGGKAIFVRMPGRAGAAHVTTQEHFPETLEAAVRQKSRWLLGIALHGWDRIGWQGGLAARYMLMRDRKALLNAIVVILAYVAAIAYAAAILFRATMPDARLLPAVVEPGSALDLLLRLTTALLVWRLAMRILFTGRQHGIAEALRALPRAFVGNIINFLAALRACTLYVRGAIRKTAPVWEKTAHRFPESVARD
ncbi:glycosyl transferase family protein [Sphingosinicella soli]|uniref:Adsorption protein B n=1 Tax=Sphingosinicella soli TaxID=333708 RepID=A0A7W7F645_9SPHN|nr:glycosyl transferase family protein [Sphingosinicella soli]MBB4631294.1 adsorption protein B [Sphingosinicella soli]